MAVKIYREGVFLKSAEGGVGIIRKWNLNSVRAESTNFEKDYVSVFTRLAKGYKRKWGDK